MTETPLVRAEIVTEALGLAELASGEVPDDIQTWLARLSLLYGVPFEHLVPDASMLPVESIRFFHLDTTWIEAMVDGAFSVGAHSDRDVRFHRLLQRAVREATAVASGRFRDGLRGGSQDGSQDGSQNGEAAQAGMSGAQRTGFLMRSEIVSGWPGLEVTAYAGRDQRSDPVAVLRLDRLAPDLLLVVLADIPGLLVLAEPAEGLHFGIGASGAESFVDPSTGRVDVLGLAASMDTGAAFGPADFAEAMVDPAAEQHFTPGANP